MSNEKRNRAPGSKKEIATPTGPAIQKRSRANGPRSRSGGQKRCRGPRACRGPWAGPEMGSEMKTCARFLNKNDGNQPPAGSEKRSRVPARARPGSKKKEVASPPGPARLKKRSRVSARPGPPKKKKSRPRRAGPAKKRSRVSGWPATAQLDATSFLFE